MDYELRDYIKFVIQNFFTQESPLQVESRQRRKLGDEIRQVLSNLSYIELEPTSLSDRRDHSFSYVFSFSIKLPFNLDLMSSRYNRFIFELNQQNELRMIAADEMVLVSSLDEIFVLGKACQALAEDRHAEDQQQTKIRKLKKSAILAHVKKFAQEEGYTFGTLGGEYDDINVYFQVGEGHTFTLKLPYKKYPEVLEMVAPAVQAMQRLYDMGIAFNLEKQYSDDWFHGEWVVNGEEGRVGMDSEK